MITKARELTKGKEMRAAGSSDEDDGGGDAAGSGYGSSDSDDGRGGRQIMSAEKLAAQAAADRRGIEWFNTASERDFKDIVCESTSQILVV